VFKEILLSRNYWKSVILLGLFFIVVFSIVEHFMQYGDFAWETFLNERIAQQKWVRYVLSRLVGGVIYGMLMAYFFELRKQKSN